MIQIKNLNSKINFSKNAMQKNTSNIPFKGKSENKDEFVSSENKDEKKKAFWNGFFTNCLIILGTAAIGAWIYNSWNKKSDPILPNASSQNFENGDIKEISAKKEKILENIKEPTNITTDTAQKLKNAAARLKERKEELQKAQEELTTAQKNVKNFLKKDYPAIKEINNETLDCIIKDMRKHEKTPHPGKYKYKLGNVDIELEYSEQFKKCNNCYDKINKYKQLLEEADENYKLAQYLLIEDKK